jgi:glutathione synthase/RimK-type ligase-like ATP-grasp enzyme
LPRAAPGGAGPRPLLVAASNAQFPDLHDDWPLLRAALTDAGVDAVTAVWNDPDVDWSAFDIVLANGTWSNIHHVDEFLAWVDGVAACGVPLRNSPATLRWNIDKHYLRDLERAGVPTVPTLWVEPDTAAVDLPALVFPATEVVVKPSISGGGNRTARYEPHEHDAARAHASDLAASGRTAMVQPYEPRVDTEGETALIYIGGTFSHAVHKGPMIRRGEGPLDNLIHNMQITGATATTAQLGVAGRALAAAEGIVGPTSYARIDLVETLGAGPALLELELLDPVLFLPSYPEAARALAGELARQVARA